MTNTQALAGKNSGRITNTQAPKQVDSYGFLGRQTRLLVKAWIDLEPPRVLPGEIPWTPLSRPLEERTVALISSAGPALNTDRPFDQEREAIRPADVR
jgi:hypothetical protein